ncbi:prephenate dehydrogenase/arogenate dehydrogenase family protein [Candidatus Saganbacteria bacterium]|nr:prephenate dehydrogenase/arogenate dehydrogenase family protein [Candidatus Saganbacteria bacterium]
MKNIAIIGLGLIGGSIGLKLKGLGTGDRVLGIPRREETLKKALEMGAIDEGSLDISRVAEADIVFLCTPINLIIPRLKELAPHLKKGAVVSDVGSTKTEIVSQAEKLMPKGTYFVGGHPMAGKEQTGIEVAEADFFKDKVWILTETSRTRQKALEEVEEVVRLLGPKVVRMDPKTHDLVVAGISHVPLAVAAMLVNLVADSEQKEQMSQCASSGFRDTTRVASGDPVLGRDMFVTNRVAVLKTLKNFRAKLLELEKLIKAGDAAAIEKELKSAKEFRDKLFG